MTEEEQKFHEQMIKLFRLVFMSQEDWADFEAFVKEEAEKNKNYKGPSL